MDIPITERKKQNKYSYIPHCVAQAASVAPHPTGQKVSKSNGLMKRMSKENGMFQSSIP